MIDKEKQINFWISGAKEDIETAENAPRTHNLLFLSEKANLTFSENDEIFLGILMKYQLEGRYPDYNPIIPEMSTVINYLNQTKNCWNV